MVNQIYLILDMLLLSLAQDSWDNDRLPLLHNIDWDNINYLAKAHCLVPIIYETVHRLSQDIEVPKRILDEWKYLSIKQGLDQFSQTKELHRILDAAKVRNVNFIIFKGPILAGLYPKANMRISSDLDLLADRNDKDRVLALFEELGYTKEEEVSKENVLVFGLASSNIIVELHFSLWEDFHGKRIDQLEFMGLTKSETLITTDIGGREVVTLGYCEHLIYQLFHIIKHFTLEGIGLRYLLDVTLYINQYINNIDLKHLWTCLSTLQYTEFCEQFFLICIQHLGLTDEILNGRKVRQIEEINDFVLDLGTYGDIKEGIETNYQVMGILTPYFVGEEKLSNSKIGQKIQIIFPKPSALRDRYHYAKRYKVLLPVAWGHRAFDHIIYNFTHRNEKLSATEKMNLAQHRLNLMMSMKLIDRNEEE